MEVKNWTSAGKIRADRIDAETIVAKLGEFSGDIKVTDLYVNDYLGVKRISTNYIEASTIVMGIGGAALSKEVATINGETIYYVGWV